eukprot:1296914-Pyramimonas_sp.AAC.1
MIAKRNACRTTGRSIDEQALNKEIRQAARQDRSNWINATLVGGHWSAVKELRKKRQQQHAGVKDHTGKLSDTAGRPDVLTEYFEQVQWQ